MRQKRPLRPFAEGARKNCGEIWAECDETLWGLEKALLEAALFLP
jgi:hypothetical protein